MTAQGTLTPPNSIQTLGGFRVTLNGTPVQRWRAGRARQLFQLLLAHHGRPIPKADLISAVWGDSPARSPEVSLKVAVCILRGIIAETGTPNGDGGGIRIVSHPASYSLEADSTFIDVEEFESLVAQATALDALGRRAEAADHYRRAVHLYTGPYLPEGRESWAMIRRERLQDALLHALGWLADDAELRGDQLAVHDLHQRILEVDPCREESYRALMRYHARARQPSRVQRWYIACATQLSDRLGLEPDRQTRSLFYKAMSGNPEPLHRVH
ncbi:BTAD domain-containing putative transcriptional regulator [Kitasatospora sp. NPDC008050]|uniref:AfsR/SARP family transcriptional regulator n=1 Tax=Kitasatospora sp. NPDC008050 TaxID=3364021 RepID=UPI0036EE5B8A